MYAHAHRHTRTQLQVLLSSQEPNMIRSVSLPLRLGCWHTHTQAHTHFWDALPYLFPLLKGAWRGQEGFWPALIQQTLKVCLSLSVCVCKEGKKRKQGIISWLQDIMHWINIHTQTCGGRAYRGLHSHILKPSVINLKGRKLIPEQW